MKMTQDSMKTAGIDIGKSWLDLALANAAQRWRWPNTAPGRQALMAFLQQAQVTRVGLEASGGYERALVADLRQADFDVVIFQPRQVRAYAVYRLRRAKTDAIDAGLIAACTAAHGPGRPAPDPRLAALAEPLRLIAQIEEDLVRLKTRRAAYQDERIRARIGTEIARLKAERTAEIKALMATLTAHPDLAGRLALLTSIPGIGQRTALTLLVLMPELGTLSREAAAALAGLAPFDRSSGQHKGRRQIAGGRSSLRTALYAAALPAAFRWNKALVAFYQRLKAAGKSHKQSLVACARKLIIYANTVIARQTPWTANNGCSG